MAKTQTLDEIEALARAHAATATLPGGYVQMDVVRLSDALLGLVAHVRALDVRTAGIDAMQESQGVGFRNAATRVMALEEKVASLEFNELEATELVAEDAAFAKTVADRALELDRLRSENARLTADLKQTGDYLMLITKECVELREERAKRLARKARKRRRKVGK